MKLSQIFRAKIRDALAQAELDRDIDAKVWTRRWTVHVQQIGAGDHATRYLSRYVYRVALSNHSLERFEHGRVTFRYTHARTHETKRLTLPVDVFIARFLQHVLPRGFTKVRYYGLLSPTCREGLALARHLLQLHAQQSAPASAVTATTTLAQPRPSIEVSASAPLCSVCPVCQRGHLHLVERFRRSRAPP
ncbi:MAG: IS91 family transposase [Gemmatimonadaceae bacterium]